MKKGTVKFFNEEKGFGFIIEEGTGKEIFVHASEVPGGKLQKDAEVTYTEGTGKKGVNATQVKLV